MSELINNNKSRESELEAFATRFIKGESGTNLIQEYESVLNTITPFETMQIIDSLLVAGIPLENVKDNTGKILNVFHKSLSSYKWDKPVEGHFLHYLMLENREVEKILSEIKILNKKIFKIETDDRSDLLRHLKSLIIKLKDYELHYIKKENILFPYIEKSFPQYRCLQIMWSFHDDFRRTMKVLIMNLEDTYIDYDLLNREIGKLFFIVYPLIFREEQIIFPVAMRAFPEKYWEEMLHQGYDQGWCYIDPPGKKTIDIKEPVSGLIDLGSGLLTTEQIKLIFDTTPFDLTFIDENDEVRFFTEGKDRIFPRSRAVVGRKVQNCHPPQSVHIVNEIIAAFRRGEKDNADFWINIRGRFIYIRYFAVRAENGEYRGTLEVSQNITKARELVNERRLLNWGD